MEDRQEVLKQNQIIEELEKRFKGTDRTFCIVTFGCQMNARDSEKLTGILSRIGFKETDTEDADIVIYNTCTVRENADLRVYGRLGQLKRMKEKDPGKIIGLCGCMMQEEAVVSKIRKSYGFVDIIFGTHNIFKFPEILKAYFDSGSRVIDLWDGTDRIVEDLPVKRKYPFKTGINIMFGCDNFCSYCIVPYVRGRERSREASEITDEIKRCVDDGVKEIMLLGQNVNSYGKGLEKRITFPELLSDVAEIPGLERIRFMTSHPKDLSDELAEVMASYENICDHFHLPLQSGSNRVLSDMNRKYTRERYMDRVELLRSKVPDISITTDIIVGYPTETDADGDDTIDIVKRAGFDSAYTFIYSRRSHTPAAALQNVSGEREIKERFDRILKAVQETGAERTKRHTGMTLPVLVEEPDTKEPGMMTGRLSCNTVVHFKGGPELTGRIVDVKLSECRGFYYMGSLAADSPF